VIVEQQVYVGGKRLENTGGNLADFLLKNELTGNAAIVEIKTPETRLLAGAYRNNVHAPSKDLSGATLQAISNKRLLQESYRSLGTEGYGVKVFDPACLLIIGNLAGENLNEDQLRSFELHRQSTRELAIVTFDELQAKASRMIDLLEK
jgi:hypothetical protein